VSFRASSHALSLQKQRACGQALSACVLLSRLTLLAGYVTELTALLLSVIVRARITGVGHLAAVVLQQKCGVGAGCAECGAGLAGEALG